MNEILHSLVPFALFGFPAAVTIAFRYFKHRERMAAHVDPHHAAALEARVAQLEHALHRVAGELDRLDAGQRFAAELATGRDYGRTADAAAAQWGGAALRR
jgi:hypothetical protein